MTYFEAKAGSVTLFERPDMGAENQPILHSDEAQIALRKYGMSLKDGAVYCSEDGFMGEFVAYYPEERALAVLRYNEAEEFNDLVWYDLRTGKATWEYSEATYFYSPSGRYRVAECAWMSQVHTTYFLQKHVVGDWYEGFGGDDDDGDIHYAPEGLTAEVFWADDRTVYLRNKAAWAGEPEEWLKDNAGYWRVRISSAPSSKSGAATTSR